ncbi:hypothetical protein C8R45DRAFT_1081267 [Mycena sanguinolenta]|nr:hypothetical protein C8R45DRAFT_1081267 [Mycena sanguinolenta]
MAPKTTKEGKDRSQWSKLQAEALLDTLIKMKATHQSGNGWKPTIWTDVVKNMQAAASDTQPAKDKVVCQNKLGYMKETFELYMFVAKFSGSGWDNDEKHATNTPEYVADFLKVHGKDYACCFKSPCPYYDKLDSIYDGMINKATGENVVHLGQKMKRKRRPKADENVTAQKAGPSTAPSDTPTGHPDRSERGTTPSEATTDGTHRAESSTAAPGLPTASTEDRQPLTPLNVVGNDRGNVEANVRFLLSPPKSTQPSRRRTRAESEDDDDMNPPKGRKRHKSDSSSSSTSVARTTAAAGSQLSCAVELLSEAMTKPVVTTTTTTEDLSHVDTILDILKDETLLPLDPRGNIFCAVSQALRDPIAARFFIAETNVVRRKGIITGIMENTNIPVPNDYKYLKMMREDVHVDVSPVPEERIPPRIIENVRRCLVDRVGDIFGVG